MEGSLWKQSHELPCQFLLAHDCLPFYDMEAVLPIQRLTNLAEGRDIWGGLQRGARQAQIEHMIQLIDELYPTFRLFLYDGLKHFCAPFTVFGPKRAAVYLGEDEQQTRHFVS